MATTGTGVTNTASNSCVDVRMDCADMWSLAQQFAHARLTVSTGPRKAKLLAFANVRARRIAATYARFYLETEEGGKPEFKGRYYWMALGAFASKTVACSLELQRVQVLPPVFMGLAKGNFWLFMDIAGWHWYWNKSPSTFWKCEPERRADACAAPVRKVIDILPWSGEALPKIDQMRTNEDVHEGFRLVEQIEKMSPTDLERPPAQLANLMAIARHEQGKVLQPLIYDDESFASWVRAQRSRWVNWASPALEVSFAAACQTDDPKLKSVAPEGTKMDEYNSRMYWVSGVANQFHWLMQEQASYMGDQLNTMAGWVDQPDGMPYVAPIPL